MTTTHGSVQANITEYWNLRGESYDTQPNHSITDGAEKDAWLESLRAALPPPPAETLDIGAGTGFMSILLAELGYRVTGIDPAEGMLAQARVKAAALASPPTFQVGDGHAPPFPDGSFDLVVNRHVLWTLRDPATAFGAWLRVLRPGGRLMAIDSLWFRNRQQEQQRQQQTPNEAWQRLYSDEVRSGLPLMEATSLDPALDLLRASGFVEVRVVRLEAVERLDRERATDGSEVTPRYAITATRA